MTDDADIEARIQAAVRAELAQERGRMRRLWRICSLLAALSLPFGAWALDPKSFTTDDPILASDFQAMWDAIRGLEGVGAAARLTAVEGRVDDLEAAQTAPISSWSNTAVGTSTEASTGGTLLNSVQLDAPTDGFILAWAGAEVVCNLGAQNTYVGFYHSLQTMDAGPVNNGISDIHSGMAYQARSWDGNDDGDYLPVSQAARFPVAAGSHTIYFRAGVNNPSTICDFYRPRITAQFVAVP